MLTRIDHVIICVPDLSQGREQYRKLEFDIHARLTTRNTPRTLYAEALASRKASLRMGRNASSAGNEGPI